MKMDENATVNKPGLEGHYSTTGAGKKSHPLSVGERIEVINDHMDHITSIRAMTHDDGEKAMNVMEKNFYDRDT